MIGPYDEEAKTPGRPLCNSYAVLPYPALWGRPVAFVDGHSWIVPCKNRTAAQRKAVSRFLGFLARHNYDWTRTGHLPAFMAMLDRPEFKALPHRSDIAAMAATGGQLPAYVQRQLTIQGLLAEEVEAAITGSKSVDTALASAERRINELLAQML